jgi:hypothetical protein
MFWILFDPKPRN